MDFLIYFVAEETLAEIAFVLTGGLVLGHCNGVGDGCPIPKLEHNKNLTKIHRKLSKELFAQLHSILDSSTKFIRRVKRNYPKAVVDWPIVETGHHARPTCRDGKFICDQILLRSLLAITLPTSHVHRVGLKNEAFKLP